MESSFRIRGNGFVLHLFCTCCKQKKHFMGITVGLMIPLLGTMLGASFVFSMKKDISPRKVTKVLRWPVPWRSRSASPSRTIPKVLSSPCPFYLSWATAKQESPTPILFLSRCLALVTEAGEMPKRRACSVTEN